jgi:hypothetical protein
MRRALATTSIEARKFKQTPPLLKHDAEKWYRFSEKIMLKPQAKAKCRYSTNYFALGRHRGRCAAPHAKRHDPVQ